MNLLLAHPLAGPMVDRTPLDDSLTRLEDEYEELAEWERELLASPHESDPVNHPAHYTGFSNGAEVIDIAENLPYNRGNAIKYLARAGAKLGALELQDLRKAQWYVNREIERLSW